MLIAKPSMAEVRYRCTNPRCVDATTGKPAEDSGRFYPDERPFAAIRCWNCHAGSVAMLSAVAKQPVPLEQCVSAMVQLKVGMHPIQDPGPTIH